MSRRLIWRYGVTNFGFMEEILEIYWSSWALLPERIVHFASLPSGKLCLQFIENPKIKKQKYLYWRKKS